MEIIILMFLEIQLVFSEAFRLCVLNGMEELFLNNIRSCSVRRICNLKLFNHTFNAVQDGYVTLSYLTILLMKDGIIVITVHRAFFLFVRRTMR